MKYTVQVPATSANCVPGFDCVGLALTLYNLFSFEPHEDQTLPMEVSFEGLGADLLEKEDSSSNLTLLAMKKVYEIAGKTMPTGKLHSITQIPPSRGLGSSSTAIVGGLVLANHMLGNPMEKMDLVRLGTRMEGHPDNVCPAIYGSLCCAMADGYDVLHTTIRVPQEISFVVVSPEVQLSTEKARAILPTMISFKEAVQNVGCASLFVSAMEQGKWHYLRKAMHDNLHVPYRIGLIPNGKEVLEAGLAAGALGTTISGAGSTLIAYCLENEEEVAKAMVSAFEEAGIKAVANLLKVDTMGACML